LSVCRYDRGAFRLSFFAGCFQFEPIPATMAAELGRAKRLVGNPSLRSVTSREQPGVFSNLISVVDLTELQQYPVLVRLRCIAAGLPSGATEGVRFLAFDLGGSATMAAQRWGIFT
jgi:hypothetical protein